MELFTPVTTPTFCPNRECSFHRPAPGWKYVLKGRYSRQHAPRQVQRFQCLACRKTFSEQTFRIGYWCRRQDTFAPVFLALISCSGLRQAARQLSLTRVVVACRVERMARHCLLLNETLRPKQALTEPVVLDGFETFAYSQYAPMHLNLLVGAESFYAYAFTESELRRKGRMTDGQKRRRAHLEEAHGRPDPRAIQRGVEALLTHALPAGQDVELRSDEHPAYRRALRNVPQAARIRHSVTPSTAPRTTRNPLFAVNLADLLLRHCSANHKRETIAFSKRHQAVVDRASLWVTWRNLLKSRSEKAQDEPPAVSLRIVPKRPTAEQLFARRLFPDHVDLPEPLRTYYERRVMTRYMGDQKIHCLEKAY